MTTRDLGHHAAELEQVIDCIISLVERRAESERGHLNNYALMRAMVAKRLTNIVARISADVADYRASTRTSDDRTDEKSGVGLS